MRDPFPTQGRIRGRLEADLEAREIRRQGARKVMESDEPVEAKTFRYSNVAGNEKVLRAIPVSVPGVAGVIPGTSPHLFDYDRHPNR